VKGWLLEHLHDHYALYGEYTGVRSARKHLGWYARSLPVSSMAHDAFRSRINTLTLAEEQLSCVSESFDSWHSSPAPFHPTTEEPWRLAA
jgi:tRNA-dihydrouridine synthase B